MIMREGSLREVSHRASLAGSRRTHEGANAQPTLRIVKPAPPNQFKSRNIQEKDSPTIEALYATCRPHSSEIGANTNGPNPSPRTYSAVVIVITSRGAGKRIEMRGAAGTKMEEPVVERKPVMEMRRAFFHRRRRAARFVSGLTVSARKEDVRQLRGWRGEASHSAEESSAGGVPFSVSGDGGGFSGSGAVHGGSIAGLSESRNGAEDVGETEKDASRGFGSARRQNGRTRLADRVRWDESWRFW